MNIKELLLVAALVATSASSAFASRDQAGRVRGGFRHRQLLEDCYGPCSSHDDCSSQLACMGGVCNDDPDMGTHICKPSPPSPTGAPSPSQPPSPGPVTKKEELIRFLKTGLGNHIISGQHNKLNADPLSYTRRITEVTGKHPGLWGGDFLFDGDDNRQRMIDEAIRQWKAGSLVALTWHTCPPTMGDRCQWDGDVNGSHLDDDEWRELVKDGGRLNKAWKQRLDLIVPYLRQLEKAGVIPIFRPIHEMNDDWAWWGGRPGPSGSRRLYEITYDYLVGVHGFKNMVWTWNVKDKNTWNIQEYFPGSKYMDVVSLDVWMQKYPTDEDYQKLLSLAGDKPIALAEVGHFPTTSVLQAQPKWTWFMLWSEFLDPLSDEEISAVYHQPRIWSRGDFKISSSRRTLRRLAEYSGDATYYYVGLGACGWDNTDDEYVAALNGAQFGDVPGSSEWCGKTVTVTGPTGTVDVRIVDKCPGCSYGDLDLSPAAFQAIAGDLDLGRVRITWHD